MTTRMPLNFLRGPLYFNGNMKQYSRVGGGHLQLLVKQVGGGEGMGVDPNLKLASIVTDDKVFAQFKEDGRKQYKWMWIQFCDFTGLRF